MSVRLSPMLRLMALFSLLLSLLPLTAAGAAFRPDGAPAAGDRAASKLAADDEEAIYIVQLRGEPLASAPDVPRGGSKDGPRADAKPDLESPQARARSAALDAERRDALASIQRSIGLSVAPLHTYKTAFNGLALRLTGAQAARIAALPEVAAVERERIYTLDSDYGPGWIGADTIWDASTTGVYAATILGANELPPVSSPASGRGTFTFTSANSTLSYSIAISGLSAPLVAAHLHRGTPDANGPVVAALTPGAAPGSYAGSIVLAPADVTALQSGGLYVNFHSAANPGGEVRGNISGYQGEGIVVGVLDSGINTTHPSFAAEGGDGYRHLNPLGSGVYKGACDPTNLPGLAQGNHSGYNPAIQCNDKLIGTWTFTPTVTVGSPAGEPSPNDDDGHGSHTASTAAGNVLLNATLNGATFPRISGVAPHANIIAYDVCGYIGDDGQYDGGCPRTALLAAIDQAVTDGVDVINYSISGGESPWTEPVEIAFRNARAAGVFVTTSAGNSGPTTGTLGHVSPWLMSVGAATHNRVLRNSLTNLTAANRGPLTDIAGAGTTAGLPSNTPLVYAGDPAIGNALCGPFSEAQKPLVAGKIVVCDRGNYGRVEKADYVKAAGGVGYVLANNSTSGNSLVADAFPIPGVHITFNDGVTLKAWLDGADTPTSRISGTTAFVADANADIMAAFSSRGPNPGATVNILKPDLAAPGVDVFAAVANDGAGGSDFGLLSGTSMASPHGAGSAALLAGLYPDWTPGQIQSALMTTAIAPLRKEDGSTPSTPFDSGAGRIRLERAALAGLVLDETIDNFVAANPDAGGDPRSLNTTNMIDASCIGTCSWTRTVRSTLAVPVTWTASTGDARLTVSPTSFTIPAGGEQTLTVTYNVVGLPFDAYTFGRVTLSAGGGAAPDAAFPVAALPQRSDLPGTLYHTDDSGATTITRQVRTIPYSSLAIERYGMVKATLASPELAETGTHTTTLTVPANTARLVAEILSTDSADADLYIYRDANGNGTLQTSSDTEVCSSATVAAVEYCNVDSPSAGVHFVLVQNFAAGGAGADTINLATAIVPRADAGNFTAIAPPISGGGPVELSLALNLPGSQFGDAWYGQIALTADGATDLGTSDIDFVHTAGPAASANLSGGGGQSAAVTAAFAQPLTVTVRDSNNNPVSGATVNFSAPASGATATLSAATAATNWRGEASVSATAGPVAGSYTVTATVEGFPSATVSFSLTNTAGAPAALSSSGQGQQAKAGVAFAQPLAVTVRDSSNNPISGVTVSFSAPASGARATLSAATATTNASGVASVTATAGGVLGSYTVTASVAGATEPLTASFSLTNLVGDAAGLTTAGQGQQAKVGTAFAQPLRVTVRDAFNNPVPGVTVSFSAPASGARATLSAATAITNASGVASVTATAGQIAGSYNVTATVSTPDGPIAVTFQLTNTTTEFKLYLPAVNR